MKKILFIILNILFINSLLANDLNNKQDIFTAYCWGCHHQTSMSFGPSFEQIANTRDIGQIQAHILNPKLTIKLLLTNALLYPHLKINYL